MFIVSLDLKTDFLKSLAKLLQVPIELIINYYKLYSAQPQQSSVKLSNMPQILAPAVVPLPASARTFLNYANASTSQGYSVRNVAKAAFRLTDDFPPRFSIPLPDENSWLRRQRKTFQLAEGMKFSWENKATVSY